MVKLFKKTLSLLSSSFRTKIPSCNMNKIIPFLIFLVAFSTASFSQSNNKAKRQKKVISDQLGRPDVPGDFLIEFGVSPMQNRPELMDQNLWGSKFFNVYYMHNVNLGNSSFSFHPGIGVGTDKFAFANAHTLEYAEDGSVVFAPLDSLLPGADIKKSKIGVNYIDIPIEFRWRMKKHDPKRSFKIAVGGKVGFLFDGKTKIKYRIDGDTKVLKRKEDFQLEQFRYGVYGKVGFGNFYLNYFYSLSNLFKSGKGPEANEAFPMNIGLTINIF